MYPCKDCVFFNEISKGCSALMSCSQEEYDKLCDEATDKCSLFLTVESAKCYATVKNGIYKALGDPIDFGRKLGSALKDSASKAVEIHDDK